jgi:protein TonB
MILKRSLAIFEIHPGQSDKDRFFVFDANWKGVKIEDAVYLLCIHTDGDSSYRWIYYNIYGPRIRVATYKDAETKVKHRQFIWYNSKGEIDSTGYYYEGVPDRTWYYRDSSKG